MAAENEKDTKPKPPMLRHAKTIRVELTEEQWDHVRSLCIITQPEDQEFTTYGPLTIRRLVTMLLEDCALAVRRPGSWEGANMLTILRAHGYKL